MQTQQTKEAKQKTPYSKNVIISVCAIVYFVSYFARKDFAAVMAQMISAERISEDLAGLVGTALFIAYGVGQLISGYLGDKISPRVLLLSGLFTTGACNLIMPLVENSYLFIPVWAINGLAQAMLWPPIIRMLADNLDREGYVLGNLVVTSAAHVSTVILYVYAPICFKYSGWQTVFFSAAALSLLAIIVFVLAMIFVLPKEPKREVPTAQRKAPEKKGGFVRTLAESGIFSVFGAIIAMGFLKDGIESWLPTLYAQAFNRPVGESTLLSAIIPVFSIISIVVIKLLYKTKLFSNEARGVAVLFGISAVLSIPLCILVGVDNRAVQMICLVLAALICGCMHGCNFLYISCLPGRFAALGRSATTSGYCNAFTYVGAAIASYGFAVISSGFGWNVTVGVWIFVAALGALLSLTALPRYTRFINDDKGA